MLSNSNSSTPVDPNVPSEALTSDVSQNAAVAQAPKMPKEGERVNAGQAGKQVLKQLKSSFAVFRKNLPLSVGIDKQILERMPDVDRKALRIALGMHTKSALYLHKIAQSEHRFDLDEKPAEALKDTHRNYARDMLKERSRKDDERRHAEKAVQEQARKEAEQQAAEQRKQDKLRQLTEKFSRGK